MQVRVPESARGAARALAEAALAVARQAMADRHPGISIEVRLIGVEQRRMWRTAGTHTEAVYDGPVIVAEATDGDVIERFAVSLCGLFYTAR